MWGAHTENIDRHVVAACTTHGAHGTWREHERGAQSKHHISETHRNSIDVEGKRAPLAEPILK